MVCNEQAKVNKMAGLRAHLFLAHAESVLGLVKHGFL